LAGLDYLALTIGLLYNVATAAKMFQKLNTYIE